jgi:hypothetical protein
VGGGWLIGSQQESAVELSAPIAQPESTKDVAGPRQSRPLISVLPRGTQIIGQRLRVGLRYAGQIVTIESTNPPARL